MTPVEKLLAYLEAREQRGNADGNRPTAPMPAGYFAAPITPARVFVERTISDETSPCTLCPYFRRNAFDTPEFENKVCGVDVRCPLDASSVIMPDQHKAAILMIKMELDS